MVPTAGYGSPAGWEGQATGHLGSGGAARQSPMPVPVCIIAHSLSSSWVHLELTNWQTAKQNAFRMDVGADVVGEKEVACVPQGSRALHGRPKGLELA